MPDQISFTIPPNKIDNAIIDLLVKDLSLNYTTQIILGFILEKVSENPQSVKDYGDMIQELTNNHTKEIIADLMNKYMG